MAINPKIVYNFNENNNSIIRDYSTEGNDASGELTIQPSSRVGNECIFDTSEELINAGNIIYLNGSEKASFHLGIKFDLSTGVLNVVKKQSQFEFTIDYSSRLFEAKVHVTSGTFIVSSILTIDTYYDIDVVLVDDVLSLFVDGVRVASDSSKSGPMVISASDLIIGQGALFSVNEFKLYDEAITQEIINAVISSQNGVLIDTVSDTDFQLGDVIVADLDYTPQYAVVTFIDANYNYRILPMSDNIRLGLSFSQIGHLWDPNRQTSFIIDESDGVTWYKSITNSSGLNDDNISSRFSSKGILLSSISVSSNYLVLDTDKSVYVDTSSGDVTLTLPASPEDNREYKIIKISESNDIIISGNGKTINNQSSRTVSTKYVVTQLIYSGIEWVAY